MKFQGIMPALITPLNADESINTAVLADLLEGLLAKGVDGFYVAGATGEGLALRPAERRVLAEECIRVVDHRKPCIIQVASTDFSEAVALAKHAEAIGAEAISATAPIFFKYDENDVYNYKIHPPRSYLSFRGTAQRAYVTKEIKIGASKYNKVKKCGQ